MFACEVESNSSSSEPLLPFCLRKHPVFFLYRNAIAMPRRATPPTGAATAMATVLVLCAPPSSLALLLSLFWRLAIAADCVTPGADEVIDVRRVVDVTCAADDEEDFPAGGGGGRGVVALEEMMEEIDSSRDEDVTEIDVDWGPGVVDWGGGVVLLEGEEVAFAGGVGASDVAAAAGGALDEVVFPAADGGGDGGDGI